MKITDLNLEFGLALPLLVINFNYICLFQKFDLNFQFNLLFNSVGSKLVSQI